MAGTLIDRAGMPRCRRCKLREVACFCESVQSLNLPFEVHILLHPLELKRPSSSVFFLQLDSQVNVHLYQRTELITPQPGDALLYPESVETSSVHLDSLTTASLRIKRLWLLEGTWQEAAKMLAKQPLIASLPRISVSDQESRYPFRKNQRGDGLSTAEALLASIDDEYRQDRNRYYDCYLRHAVASMNGHAPC
ncbi:DTW domain-containing protein [Umboniibacter marinipuniceus]|uniref:tRNA-uridine aminocarboxypropyltransferase n=1 Tax=Umboniibacter marinipuniceus TaxID=569599 RepID=A0A3M0A8Z2_9GAMM|nr:tRNA-uridine aminocarboxypropyltransferase [Umboniibacter marinipuniceus]RMA78875.1 DTW domain-containing protein YfiP [Umboniibacter marinipuniceus]